MTLRYHIGAVTGDRQYILSLRHGDLLHKDALIDLLTKDNEEA